ncbi:MAG: hypothetical protein FXV79_04900 [Candidatus Thioglobus sp.]|nr:MAG: hypothetical protein FXV79_04900 [Candidatus Thioglobus sp.]
MTTPFIGIVPYELRRVKDLGDIPLAKIDGNLTGKQAGRKIKDLGELDHIIVFPSSKIWLTSYTKLKCNVSLMIAEPKPIHRKYYHALWLLKFKFHKIFIRYTKSANQYKNVLIVPIVSCWIPVLSLADFSNKNQLISIIASDKKFLIGRKLRHQIIAEITDKNIAILGRGYKSFKDKKDGLLPYHFSIVIENYQETDYFTEKLLDAFACKTVPIYWGCPNIGDYFDIDGIIIFNNIDELKQIVENLSVEDYQKYAKIMEKNLKTARALSSTRQLIERKLAEQDNE